MYELTKLNSTQQKMQKVLQTMTDLKFRQLQITDLEKIYLTLIRTIDITNCNTDLFKDISRTIFIINHYYNIENSNKLLLESLHLCKLNSLNDDELTTPLNYCIYIVGNFEINSNLIQVVTNITLLADYYLSYMGEVTEKIFWEFIKTTTDASSFSKSSFYLSLSDFVDDNKSTTMFDLFKNTDNLLANHSNFQNYSEFIKWYISYVKA